MAPKVVNEKHYNDDNNNGNGNDNDNDNKNDDDGNIDIIEVCDLDWSYNGDNKLFERLNIRIKKNRFYCVVGPNGSGKTTLIKIIARGLNPGVGKVFINGADITGLKHRDIAKVVAMVPQYSSIDFDFSVLDIVLMGRMPYVKRFQSESAHDMDVVKSSMEGTDIWNLRDKNINRISGGERQRVILARGLAQEAEILLLDEPVSQLDIQHQVGLMDLVRKLVDEKRKTAVAVLHDMNLAATYCDEMILMNNGSVIAVGSPEEVLTKENLERVYSINVLIIENPINGRPYVVPAGLNTSVFPSVI
jgi:iron complex transport system ATP-binding protein